MPGSENRYESIVFRAADVKDLTIDDPNPEVAPPPAQPAFQDPAIIGVSVHSAS
jgi:protein LSM14